MPDTWVPRKISAMIAMMAMRARINAYSARPWPSSSRRDEAIRANSCVIRLTPFPVDSPVGCDGAKKKTAGQVTGGLRRCVDAVLDRVADGAQDRADLVAQEDQRDDRDDRDEGEDQRVLRETLAFLVTTDRGEERVEERHVGASWMSTHPQSRAAPLYECARASDTET